MVRSIPQLAVLGRRLANEFTLELKVVQVETLAAEVLAQIPEDTDAVFIGNCPGCPKGNSKNWSTA